MKVTAQDQPHIIDKMSATFETYWHSEDFTSYEPQKDEEKLRRAIDRERGRSSGTDASSYAFDIQPYPYQQAILDALDTERRGKDRLPRRLSAHQYHLSPRSTHPGEIYHKDR